MSAGFDVHTQHVIHQQDGEIARLRLANDQLQSALTLARTEIERRNGADPDYGDWFWPSSSMDSESCADDAHEAARRIWDDGCEDMVIEVTRAVLLPNVYVAVTGPDDGPKFETFASRELADAALRKAVEPGTT